MQGIIVINAFSGIGEHQAERLISEFKKLGVEVLKVYNSVGKVSAKGIDFAIFLDKDVYTAKALEQSGVRVFNSAEAISVCDDKLLTDLALQGKVKTPKTLASSFCYTEKAPVTEDELNNIIDEIGLPLIFKIPKQSQGKGVFLVKTKEELKDYVERYRTERHLYQKFISASEGSDIRVITVGKEVVASMRRVNKNDFRSNVESGGVGERCVISEQMQNIAVEVSKTLNLDYCGIDFLIDADGTPLVCEVNSNAFFKGIESVSGVNVARAYADYIKRVIGI
ncbi:MAG: RimK family alpha-L-glutamate ligase [Clostridia bacterium]|nr:RimK family alpha-L-glutamate ligase [Clostridia bacterium]